MPISITHALLPIHLSRNPIDIEFTCPDKHITLGKYFRRSFAFSTYPTTDGATFTYTYTKDGEEIACTFTFRTAPDPELQEILLYPGSGELDWVTNHLIPGLLANPNMAQDFLIGMLTAPTYLFWDAQFYAPNSGTISAVSGCLPISGTPKPAAMPSAQPNYRLSAWLYVGDGQEVQRTGEIELDADNEQKVKLDLQNYADTLLTDVETPTNTLNVPILCTKINKLAYIVYGQKWGDIPERKKNYRTPEFRIQKGGMEDRQFAAVKSTLGAHLAANYLTLRRERTLRSGQKDWLYWLCPPGITGITLNMSPTYATSSGSSAILFNNVAVTPGRAYQFRIDKEIFAFLPDLISYALILTYNDGTTYHQAERVTVKLQDTYLDQVFEFENTFGAIESILFTGERTLSATASKQPYSTQPKFNAAATDSNLHTHGELVGKSITCSTGALTASESLAIIDFLRSRHIWYITPTGSRIPVRIPKADAVIESINRDANYARGAEFTAEISLSKSVSAQIV